MDKMRTERKKNKMKWIQLSVCIDEIYSSINISNEFYSIKNNDYEFSSSIR